MHAQAPAHLRHRDQLLHELRLFPLQLRELVDDNEEVRDRQARLVVLVEAGVLVDVVDAVLVEDPLPALVLALDGDHRPAHLVAGEVRDLPHHVRQIRKEVGHAAALVVDDEKSHVVRAEIEGQREYVGLKRLGFAGTGGAGDEAVRPVILLVDVEIAGRAAALDADDGPHGLVGTVLGPAALDHQVLHALRLIHLEEGERARDLPAFGLLKDPDVGQPLRELRKAGRVDAVEDDVLPLRVLGAHGVGALHRGVIFNDVPAGIGQFLVALVEEDRRQPVLRARIHDIFGNKLALEEGGLRHEQHVPGQGKSFAGGSLFLRTGADDRYQLVEDVRGILPVVGHEAGLAVLGPDVGEPFRSAQQRVLRALLPVVDEGHLHLGVGVAGRDLRHQGAGRLVGAGLSSSAQDADQLVFLKVRAHRHVMEVPVALADLRGLVLERILVDAELLLRHVHRALEGHRAQAEAREQEILLGGIPAPELHAAHVVPAAGVRGRIHPAHGGSIFLILLFDGLLLFDQIAAVGLPAVPLLLKGLLSGVSQVDDGPEAPEEGGAHRSDEAGVHHRGRAGAAL